MMRANLLKTFFSALAGSALLVVALFAMSMLRPESTVVQAAPAAQAPALAATKDTTTTMDLDHDPMYPTYSEVFSLSIVRDESLASFDMVATLLVNGKVYSMDGSIEEWALKSGEVTSTVDMLADLDDNPWWGAGANYVTATIWMSDSFVAKLYDEVHISPMISWDSSVRNIEYLKLGEKLSATVKVRPEANYMTYTNEMVKYDFDYMHGSSDNEYDAEVTIGATTSYTKSGKPDSTYVFTENVFYTKAGTYTMKAEYVSVEDLYGSTKYPSASVTETIGVQAPMLTYMLQDPTGEDITTQNSGGPLVMKMGASYALSPTVAWFYAMPASDPNAPSINAQVMVSGTQAMTNPTAPQVTGKVTYATGVAMLSSVYGEENPDDLPTGMQLPEGMKLVSMSKPITLTVDGEPVCNVDSIDLSAIPAATDRPIATGKQYTVTATLQGEGASGGNVSFTVEGDGVVNPASGTGDEDGIVTTYVTSETSGTMTLQATACADTTPVTATLEGLSFEKIVEGKEYDPNDDDDFVQEFDGGNITIRIPSGAYDEGLIINVTRVPFDQLDGVDQEINSAIPTIWGVYAYYKVQIEDLDGNDLTDTIVFEKIGNTNGLEITIQINLTSMLQQDAVTVPATQTQLLRLGNYRNSIWSTTVADVTGNSMSAQINTPGKAFAVVTAAREVYLPLIGQMTAASPTTSTVGF